MSALSLTFDDGPEPVWTEQVLRELGRCRVRATFFLIGERVLEYPRLARAIVSAGHEAQLHCHRHVRHSDLSEAELIEDTRQGLDALVSAGVSPDLWRAPWGVQTPASERVAQRFGLTLVRWSIDTHDWRGDTPAEMLSIARPALARGGAVLMHDGLGPGALREECENTVRLIAPLSEVARELGIPARPLGEPQGALAA
ncbi:MAG TPA: polysaccharide deacetylase family protein [Solirubrobacteraceae bacterium]|nr:polysaccharide deacetylase family protein [Solirubrobacteraceae bacterium]